MRSSDEYEDLSSAEQGSACARSIEAKLDMMLQEPPVMAEEYLSETSEAQAEVSGRIERIYKQGAATGSAGFLQGSHLDYVDHSLYTPLPSPYVVLDSNHGWMVYWLLNSYAVMNHEIDEATRKLASEKIGTNIVENGLGGISSGVGQIGHCASTYASVLALVLVEDWSTLKRIRMNLLKWFLSLKQKDGSFIMHKNGESDTRSTYAVLAVAFLLGISTPELTNNTLTWVSSCQSYEGGFAGTPQTEAHGGYLFCALASYFLVLNQLPTEQHFDIDAFARWSVLRQNQLEGGLSGRTGKLVDGCYSFWVGATFPLVKILLDTSPLFDREALEIYILKCCQSELGGFKDKPGKLVDFYHTNYVLCGLSITQHDYSLKSGKGVLASQLQATERSLVCTSAIHPVLGIPVTAVEKCMHEMGEKAA